MKNLNEIHNELRLTGNYRQVSGNKKRSTVFFYTHKDKDTYYGCIGYVVIVNGQLEIAHIDRSIV